jgi:prepilin-type N-terminal cleavage/methylation domain-containing protein
MKRLTGNKGFTLIELLIVLSIMVIISGVMALTTGMIYRNYNIGFDKSLALKQVDLASIMISRDINRAKTVGLGANSGFPLELTCYDPRYDSNGDVTEVVEQNIIYKYDIDKSTITREVVGGTAAAIARYITSPPATKIEGGTLADKYTCTITIKAKYNQAEPIGIYTAQQRVPNP